MNSISYVPETGNRLNSLKIPHENHLFSQFTYAPVVNYYRQDENHCGLTFDNDGHKKLKNVGA